MGLFGRSTHDAILDEHLEAARLLNWQIADAIAQELGDHVERCGGCGTLFRLSVGCFCGATRSDGMLKEELPQRWEGYL